MARQSKTYQYEKENEKRNARSSGNTEAIRQVIIKGIITNYNFVNLRESPSKDGKSVAVLERGDQVLIQKRVKDYYKVMTVDGTEGFIPCNYCKES